MGIFDFLKKNDVQGKKEHVNSKNSLEALNPLSRERDEEQEISDQVTAPGTNKSFVSKDRAPASSHEYYEVQEGDTLGRIAKERYGDADKWEIIYEANKKEIKEPDKIYPGQMIELPNFKTKAE